MLLEPRMVVPFPEVKDKNQDTKATNIHLGGGNGGQRTAKSQFSHCMKQKLTQPCIALLRRFSGCLMDDQGN